MLHKAFHLLCLKPILYYVVYEINTAHAYKHAYMYITYMQYYIETVVVNTIIYAFLTHNYMKNPVFLKEKGHLSFLFPKFTIPSSMQSFSGMKTSVSDYFP